MHTRYIITAVKKDKVRHMALSNNNTNTHLTIEAATNQMNDIIKANNADTIANTLGVNLRIDPVICYPTGDASRTVFPN